MTDFRIADTFTASLARLTGEEQKAVKTTAFDLQLNPTAPGHRFHRLDKARDKHFWSVRVSSDIRLIVHKVDGSLLLCYVDHHDKAYAWAERRKLETHPRTGAAQFVEIRERVEEVVVQRAQDLAESPHRAWPRLIAPSEVTRRRPVARAPLFSTLSADDLLGYGIPEEWLAEVRVATKETLFAVIEHLPAEAAEALLELATGGAPKAPVRALTLDPLEHPDARRRFRVIASQEELRLALDSPWDKWTVFLHPAQRDVVERRYNGPARVAGTAGTGKTIVALHRAVHLARINPEARVLLTTLTEALAASLQARLRRLVGDNPRLGERVEVQSIPAIARRLHERNLGPVSLVTEGTLRQIVRDAVAASGDPALRESFVLAEWNDVVDAWQLTTWDQYREVQRLGRKTRLPEARRAALWRVFDQVRQELAVRQLSTEPMLLAGVAAHVLRMKTPPFEFVIVDEAQDVSVAQLKLLAALGRAGGEALFFAGDLGQRIFQQAFSWRSLGVDVRGRSTTLKVNYRTSHQIRAQADRLLGREIADVDGNVEVRSGTVSVLNGAPPTVLRCDDQAQETTRVAEWIRQRLADGVAPSEIGIFVRSTSQLGRAQAACDSAGIEVVTMVDAITSVGQRATLTTMHLAKGLEYRAVVVVACDESVLPLRERMEAIGDEADLEEVYVTERHLLYVACTRARDFLCVSGVSPVSEFIDDLSGAGDGEPLSFTN